ncbi:MAG: type II toxin-antitoxin system VapC family toxin [Microvirga sp.]
MVLIDTNVVSDLVTDDPDWYPWSLARIEEASLRGSLLIVDVVYAELAVLYQQVEDLDGLLEGMGIDIAPMTRSGLFVAAKAFQIYRQRGGAKSGVLPDFFIGAHAAVAGMPLLTRDARRYATYFPTVELIAPNLERK